MPLLLYMHLLINQLAQIRPGVPMMVIDEVHTLYSWGVRLEEENRLRQDVSTSLNPPTTRVDKARAPIV